MMRRHFPAVLLAAALPAAGEEPSRVLLALMDPPAIARSCEEGLARARTLIAAMEAKPDAGAFLDEWDDLQIAIEDTESTISTLGVLHPDKAVREAAEPCQQKYTALNTELMQNAKLHARLSAYAPRDAREAKLKRDLGNEFEDTGITLPPDKRARAKEIFTRLEELRQAFVRGVRDDRTTVRFTPAEMAGLTEAYLKARKRDAEGNYLLGLDEPSYGPFMSNAHDEPARKRYYLARMNQGGAANLKVLEESFRLRQELAALYGLPTYAHYSQRRKMVGDPAVVTRFLAEVKGRIEALERAENAEFTAAKAKHTGVAGAKLARWDVSYYQERIRKERFAVDQEEVRKYFPVARAVDYALLVAHTLYGLEFTEAKVPTWHPEVRYFDVRDGAGAYVGGIYLDLHPREGKRSGAWAGSVRQRSRHARRTPLVTLAANMDRVGFNQREMETLFHEFGHVLHGMLADTDYVAQSGYNVKRDFVEAPSQMFEEWVRREQPLALFAKVCPECPRLTPEQIGRLEGARRFGMGTRYAGQWLLASFDMSLSTNPRAPMQAWKALESATPLGHVEGTQRPASFMHIAGTGYAAGYYGYMWSEVLALDMLTPFKKDMLDPKVGARYRDTILARGATRDEMEMVREFLGRDPSSDSFFAEIAGKR